MLNRKAWLVVLWLCFLGNGSGTMVSATEPYNNSAPTYVLGEETAYRGKDVEEIARSIRRQSDLMLEAMANRDAAAVNAFYGDHASYVGSGAIGDWKAITASTAARYAQRKSVDCAWADPFRIDVLARDIAVVTTKVSCKITDQSDKTLSFNTTRLEVLRRSADKWIIVAFHEAPAP
jgi:ketosteroid isomerase-like protein